MATKSLSLLHCLYLILVFLLLQGEGRQMENSPCDASCPGSSSPDLSYRRGVRYTYRYSTGISTTLHGANSGRNGLALDCVVDIETISNCHLTLQIRNSQIKRISPQKEHSVPRFKSLRESLERTRLKFSLRGGKVTALCPQEGEQVWALNIKRALLSMLQTSHTASKQDIEKETDIYGTCHSRYEQRGSLLIKTRNLKECQEHRLSDFWSHSVSLTEDTTVDSKLQCAQRTHRTRALEEVNCTETVSMVTGQAGLVKTQTLSTLSLLRAQPDTPSGLESLGPGLLTDLMFDQGGGARRSPASTRQQASESVGLLCGLTRDQQQLSQHFLQLVFQLKDLSLSQLKMLWMESSFNCRDDWQPLLSALPACGSESCVLLLTELMQKGDLDGDQAQSCLTTIALTPHPSPLIVNSINALLEAPELRPRALLAGSSVVHALCRRSVSPCTRLPPVHAFVQALQDSLGRGCAGEEPERMTELLYVLKAVGNSGLSAPALVALLSRCVLSSSAATELQLAAIHAFRRMPCTTDRSVLLQLYASSQEEAEVRVAAYQQLMRCPDPRTLRAVRTTLRNETSSQVGSYVWSHLTAVLKSEDPTKQSLMAALPDDIISKDFEAEFWKYSSYSDYTVSTAHNLLEVDLRMENAEPLLKNLFGHPSGGSERDGTAGGTGGGRSQSKNSGSRRRRESKDSENRGGNQACSSSISGYLDRAKAMLTGRRRASEDTPRCWVGVKVFGNEISAFTCDDLLAQFNQLSLSVAGLAVKLLKGQEVQLSHRAVLMAEELVLPSLSGMPVRLAINMTSLLSLRLKGNVNYRDTGHFSLAGFIKPNAFVGLSGWMGVDGPLGQAGVEWASELSSSTSLDGSVQLQEGQDLRVTLNTPEDYMDILSLSSRVFQVSGDHREEMKGPKTRQEKTSCTPKIWSKMVGWQVCSNVSYPSPPTVAWLPPPGPAHLSIRLLKLDRGLHYYLMEAAYSLVSQRSWWLPREASLHVLLATPQSSIPRDMSLDLVLHPQRILLKVVHPLKTILMQGQLVQERNTRKAKMELSVDGVHHYYFMASVDTKTVLSEQRSRYHLEAKLAPGRPPMILSANVTRGLGRKISFSANVKNVFKETLTVLVALERRLEESGRKYSVEGEVLLPGVLGSRVLGLMEEKAPLWSSALRLKYGVGDEARHLRHECYTSQSLRRETTSDLSYSMRAEHEFYCSNTASVNHKIAVRHEESPSHARSSLDASYGKHWDEINNKRKLHLSQSFKNQSTQNHTSYTMEFSLQVPEKHLNYRTQLLHSHLREQGSESSSHLKVNYNDLMPLVAGLQWRSPAKDAAQKKWEGTFTMDTPWLYVFMAQALSRPQSHTLQLSAELTARRWLSIRGLALEALYKDRGWEKEARLHLYTPALTYVKAGGWGVAGKQGVKSSWTLSSLWTLPLRGQLSLEGTRDHPGRLQLVSSYGRQNLSLSAALNTLDKNLKKSQVVLKMVYWEPRSSPTELELEGTVEELKKDPKMYQKTAVLRLRQPFRNFPQSLLLRQTFTVDLVKGLYILESRAGFHSDGEVVHTLTLGYKPPSPFVCSALVHPFGSYTLPTDSELCLTMFNNQTQREVQGRLRVGSKEKLTFHGQVLQNPPDSEQRGVRVQANFSHLLQLQLPSSALLEGDVQWSPVDSSALDYLARGRLRIERQESQFSLRVNGTAKRIGLFSSLSHPFKSKIPKTVEVHATVNPSLASGRGWSSIRVVADGKDRARLGAQLSHSLRAGDRAVGLRLNFSQSLVPGAAADLTLNVTAGLSADRVSVHGSYTQGHKALLLQARGSVNHTQGLQLSVTGDLRHSLAGLGALPTALGLDGALGMTEGLTEGQLRLRVMEVLYLYGDQSVCVNASRQFKGLGKGVVYANLSHSSDLLSTTGVPANNTAKVSWTNQGGLQASLLAELLAGAESLRAGLSWAKTGRHDIPRWELHSMLQHRSGPLANRGLPSSIQADAHYQREGGRVFGDLVLHIEKQKMLDAHFNAGMNNSTANVTVSLWQQIRQLKEVMPTSLQMNCTGDSSADRLSGQCYGSTASRSAEVRAFRSSRPHGRLCYGLALAYLSLGGQAKGCISPAGQAELRGNLTHSSRLLLTSLGLPTNSSLRLLLRPGPLRWTLGLGLVAGRWRASISTGLRAEAAGAYGWHLLGDYGTPGGGMHKTELMGRVRLTRWCHIWVDVGGAWDSVSYGLTLTSRCEGLGRLAWTQVWDLDRTSLSVQTLVKEEGLQGSLVLENQQDVLRGLLRVLLKKNRQVELRWSLEHQWASLAGIIPNRVDLQGSARLLNSTSVSGSASLSFFDTSSTRVGAGDAWTLRRAPPPGVKPQHGTAELPEAPALERLAFSTLAGSSQAPGSDTCSVFVSGCLQQGADEQRTVWRVYVHQLCPLLKTPILPREFSINGSVLHASCATSLNTHILAMGKEKARLSLSLECHPHFSLRGSVQHSMEAVQTRGVPTHGALVVAVSTAAPPSGVELGLELGECYFRSNLGRTQSPETLSAYAFNMSHHCPALQKTVLPTSMDLQGFLSAAPCQLTLSGALQLDHRDASLELAGQTCKPLRLSGALTHSFPGLRARGLPLRTTVEASGPGAPGETADLLIKTGSCYIEVKALPGTKGRVRWLLAMESKCPLLQAHLNGSVAEDSQGVWTAAVNTGLDNERGSLRLSVRAAAPELRVDGRLSHNLSALLLHEVPGHGRLSVSLGPGRQGYVGEALLHIGQCTLGVTGGVIPSPGLQGSVVYNIHNCTVAQRWGSPNRMQASGSMNTSRGVLETWVSMAMDKKALQASYQNQVSVHLNHTVPLLKRVGLPSSSAMAIQSGNHGNGSYHYLLNCSAGTQQFTEKTTVTLSSAAVELNSSFSQTVNFLKTLGVPENNSIQMELSSGEEKTISLQSQLGAQQVGLGLKMKAFSQTTELRGTMWLSWLSPEHRRLPLIIEGLCSVRGGLSRFQSKARLTVDGRKLLATGFNVSAADGRLAAALSFDRPASTPSGGRGRSDFETTLTAQFKAGPLRSLSADVRLMGARVSLLGDVGEWGPRGGATEARLTLKHSVDGQTTPVFQCSMAVNPALGSSMALIIQGHRLQHSKELMVKVVQNIPQLLLYLPGQLNARTQANHSSSRVAGVMELSSGRRRLWAQWELAAIEGGYRQAVELNHTFPQLKPLPRAVAVRTLYEARNWSYQVQHGAVWGNQEIRLTGVYSVPPSLETGNQGLQDSIQLDWSRHGRLEQVRAVRQWSVSGERSETRVDLRQPFTASLSQVSLHAVSHVSQRLQGSRHEGHLSWTSPELVNVSLTLNRQWHNTSHRERVCGLFSTQDGTLYSQSAELRWGNSSVKQAVKYQVQTNLRDSLEHSVVLALCPPQRPTLSWSGSHKVNSGQELLHSHSRLSVGGRPHHCSLTLVLRNSSTGQLTNMSLSVESKVGNWGVEVGGEALSSAQGPELHVRATLDRNETLWLRGSMEGKCLRTAAGFRAAVCVGTTSSKLALEIQRRAGATGPEGLVAISVGTANQHLTLKAQGCFARLLATELFDSLCFPKSPDGGLVQEMSALLMNLTSRAESLLSPKDGGLWARWRSGPLRALLTDSVPRCLALLQQASALGQQELRRPLSTVAGVYHDLTGQRVEVLWRKTVSGWAARLAEALPPLLENPQLRPMAEATLAALGTALDVAKLTAALSGVRTRLASVYKLSHRDCSVSVAVPLPRVSWHPRTAEAGLVEVLLEEWLLGPLKALTSIRPAAEFYRLKHRVMDSPFLYQALLVADQYVVSFDGLLYQLPVGLCPVVLAQDRSKNAAFTLLLSPRPQSHHFLSLAMNGSTLSIFADGQVKNSCHLSTAREPRVAVRRTTHAVEVSNQNGLSVLCDLSLDLCSLTLDGWLHGTSVGLLGTNDNEAGNELPLPHGSQAASRAHFIRSWQVSSNCSRSPDPPELCSRAALQGPAGCHALFSSPHSPLSSCFRVVDPGQFLVVCKASRCTAGPLTMRSACRLAAAFVHLCQRNHVPLDLPCIRERERSEDLEI
ncbi:hypothetical protein NHX12_003920 [Muraenolepis orangiensis]|uniref:Vitellogenin domain-containing protein n=1 Tax=Muraenolepis orangiensis TaxID=630683 RepID=A0A9Q0IE75_9TELE|nr:hypothetical protein NHX12_003920 [Muraenolepis orangiensis]